MRTTFYTARRAACFGAVAAILSACSAAQPALTPPTAAQQSAHRGHAAGSGDLLYVGGNHVVEVYAYPDGTAAGSFKTPGAVSSVCSDTSGNVFVTELPKRNSPDGTGSVVEYAHGGTSPIASLTVPSGEMPMDCASDASSGNLAVTMQNSGSYAPTVAVYAGGSGKPAMYDSSVLGADPSCGYDAQGNLFVTSGGNVMAELAAGKKSFATITLNRTLGGVKHVQWDGTDLALQSFHVTHHNGEKLWERVFRVKVSGSSGKIVGISEFTGWSEKVSGGSWIDGDTIVATPFSNLSFYKYPDGGKPTKVIHLSSHMAAVTISIGG